MNLFAAEELAIKALLPPYLDPSLKPQDLLTGVNFASGVSGYDPLTSQVRLFISILSFLCGSHSHLFKMMNAVSVVVVGSITSVQRVQSKADEDCRRRGLSRDSEGKSVRSGYREQRHYKYLLRYKFKTIRV